MKTKLVQVATRGEYQMKVSDYLAKGYSIVDKTDKSTVLRVITKLNAMLFVILLACGAVPGFLYLAFYLMRRKNELVTVEFTAL